MKGQEDSKTRRRLYQKPRVEQVELRPEEAVLGGCKNFTDAGEQASDCYTPTQCLDFGS